MKKNGIIKIINKLDENFMKRCHFYFILKLHIFV